MAGAVRVRAFVADMPDMNPEQLALAYSWASKKKEFEKWSIQARDGGYLLAAVCQDEKSVRQWQSLVRTNLQHWNVSLATTPQKGWLRAISAEQYEEIIGEDEACDTGESETWEYAHKEPHEQASTPTVAQVTPVPPVAQVTTSTVADFTALGFGRLSLPENLLYNGGERFKSLHSLHSRVPVAVR